MAIIRDPAAQEQPTPIGVQGIVKLPAAGPSEAAGRGLEILGASLGVGADEIYRAQKIQEERADTTQVEEAWNNYKKSTLDVTTGQNGTLTTQAGDAVNGKLIERTTAAMGETRKTLMAGLANDEQRRRFNARADATDLQTMHQTLVHLDNETRKYAEVTMEGSAAQAGAQVIAEPRDPFVWANAKDALLHQADAYLKTHGVLDQGKIDDYKAKLTDELWRKRLETLVYKDPVFSQKLFREFEGEIKNPDLKLRLKNLTGTAALFVGATNDAQDVVREFRDRVPPASANPDVARGNQNISFLQQAISNAQTEDARVTLQHELETETNRVSDLQRVSSSGGVIAPNTSGLPNSRDVAAQLPLIMTKVEAMATERFGAKKDDPDRVAYVKAVTQEIHAQISHDVQYLNAIQRKAEGTVLDAVMGLAPPAPGSAPG